MSPKPATLALLVASVLALVGGPILFMAFLYSPLGWWAGGLLTGAGAFGLWIGMRRLPPPDDPVR